MGARSSPPDPASAGITTLKRRQDFLSAARALKAPAGGLFLQARDRGDGDPAIRVGFTCSKKVGNAVTRNRAKRRLRAVARDILPRDGRPGWDYVLVGLNGRTVARPFDRLAADLRGGLARVHRTPPT